MNHSGGSASASSVSNSELFARVFAHNSTFDYIKPYSKILRRDVSYALSVLNSREVYSTEWVPPIFLRRYACILPRQSLQSFSIYNLHPPFPTCWKFAYIQLVPIRGIALILQTIKLQPIALTTCISKVFEFILIWKILKHLPAHNLLSDCNYRFHKGGSTGDLLAFLTEFWSSFHSGTDELLLLC